MAAVASSLAGCAEFRHATALAPPPVNPSSPIAPYAQQVSQETFATPSFLQVPPKPIDVPPPGAYKLSVLTEVKLRQDLAVWRATHPQLTSDTEAWADLQRKRIPASSAPQVSVTHDAESEAFARRLREEAGKTPAQP